MNRLGARYVVVGGFAIIQAGYFRTTEHIDLLIDTTPENEARVIESLLIQLEHPLIRWWQRLKRRWRKQHCS